uniref:Uncharacterized protein n=1 Tax=Rhizophora mucronata TaxID=61149 RepID=A0A2P2PRA1_RHIMU
MNQEAYRYLALEQPNCWETHRYLSDYEQYKKKKNYVLQMMHI